MNTNQRKYQLIEKIIGIQDEKLLMQVEAILQFLLSADEDVNLIKPLRADLNIEELVQEQGFEGIDSARFKYIVEQIGIQENIEDLLEQL